jgi:hypothetical protein
MNELNYKIEFAYTIKNGVYGVDNKFSDLRFAFFEIINNIMFTSVLVENTFLPVSLTIVDSEYAKQKAIEFFETSKKDFGDIDKELVVETVTNFVNLINKEIEDRDVFFTDFYQMIGKEKPNFQSRLTVDELRGLKNKKK